MVTARPQDTPQCLWVLDEFSSERTVRLCQERRRKTLSYSSHSAQRDMQARFPPYQSSSSKSKDYSEDSVFRHGYQLPSLPHYPTKHLDTILERGKTEFWSLLFKEAKHLLNGTVYDCILNVYPTGLNFRCFFHYTEKCRKLKKLLSVTRKINYILFGHLSVCSLNKSLT